MRISRRLVRPAVAPLALTVVLLCAAACSEKLAAPATPTSVAGVYRLTSIDGGAPPRVVATNTQFLQLLNGIIVVGGDGTFRDSTTAVSIASGDTLVLLAAGTYQYTGNTMVFNPDDSPSYQMTSSGNNLTQQYYESVLGYVRVH